jgi:hypothetical protein
VRRDQNAWIGRVSEMAQIIQVNARGISIHVVRIWLRGTKPVQLEDDKLYLSRTERSFAMQVLYESMLVCAVEPVETVDPVRCRFRYC